MQLANPRRKEQTGFDVWQPDLFAGRGKERGEGKSREEQLRHARAEMRDTGSRSLFELFDDEKGEKRNPMAETNRSLAILGAVGLAAWWLHRSQPPKPPPPLIPSGADPLTGQYGQQTGQGYPPQTPPRTNYLLNPLIARQSTQLCAAQVRQLRPQHPAAMTTREGAGQAGPPGAWVYTPVALPVQCGPVGNGRGGWGNGGR